MLRYQYLFNVLAILFCIFSIQAPGFSQVNLEVDLATAVPEPQKVSLRRLDDQLYFGKLDAFHGKELWTHDISNNYSGLIHDIDYRWVSGYEAEKGCVHEQKYYFVVERTDNQSVFVYDPASGIVDSISAIGSFELISELKSFNGRLYLGVKKDNKPSVIAYESQNDSVKWYNMPSSLSFSGIPDQLSFSQNILFFTGTANLGIAQLYKLDLATNYFSIIPRPLPFLGSTINLASAQNKVLLGLYDFTGSNRLYTIEADTFKIVSTLSAIRQITQTNQYCYTVDQHYKLVKCDMANQFQMSYVQINGTNNLIVRAIKGIGSDLFVLFAQNGIEGQLAKLNDSGTLTVLATGLDQVFMELDSQLIVEQYQDKIYYIDNKSYMLVARDIGTTVDAPIERLIGYNVGSDIRFLPESDTSYFLLNYDSVFRKTASSPEPKFVAEFAPNFIEKAYYGNSQIVIAPYYSNGYYYMFAVIDLSFAQPLITRYYPFSSTVQGSNFISEKTGNILWFEAPNVGTFKYNLVSKNNFSTTSLPVNYTVANDRFYWIDYDHSQQSRNVFSMDELGNRTVLGQLPAQQFMIDYRVIGQYFVYLHGQLGIDTIGLFNLDTKELVDMPLPNGVTYFNLQSINIWTGQIILYVPTIPEGNELIIINPVTKTLNVIGLPDHFTWSPPSIRVYHELLFFPYEQSSCGYELFSFNPLDSTLALVADIFPGHEGSTPQIFGVHAGKLYFSADDGLHGRELWSYSKCFESSIEAIPSYAGQNTGKVTVAVVGGTAPYSYQWNTGATSATLNGVGQGLYVVTITDANGCQSTLSVYVDQLVCFAPEAEQMQLRVYPNPFGQRLTLEATQPLTGFQSLSEAKIQVQLLDLQGRMITSRDWDSTSPLVLDGLDLPAGVYFLRLRQMSNGTSRTVKVVCD